MPEVSDGYVRVRVTADGEGVEVLLTAEDGGDVLGALLSTDQWAMLCAGSGVERETPREPSTTADGVADSPSASLVTSSGPRSTLLCVHQLAVCRICRHGLEAVGE